MDRAAEWQLFVAVATRRSFAEAARALGRSPQAVTRAIASLEARVGVRLLHRTTRAVSLTGEGERHLERARRLIAELDELETIGDRDAPLAGRLAITAPLLFGQLHVVPLVVDFLRRHPAVDVRLRLVDRVVSLAEEGLDVAVRLGALADSGLLARRVGEVRTVVCASPAYLRRAGMPRAPEDLARHPCIAFSAATPVPERWSFRDGGRERRVTVRPRLVVDSGLAAVDAARAGLGLARVPSYQIAGAGLRVVLEDFEPPPLPVHLVRLPGAPSRIAEAFLALAEPRLRSRAAGSRPASRP